LKKGYLIFKRLFWVDLSRLYGGFQGQLSRKLTLAGAVWGTEYGQQRTPAIFAVIVLLSNYYRIEQHIKSNTHAATYAFLIGLAKSASIDLYARLQTFYC